MCVQVNVSGWDFSSMLYHVTAWQGEISSLHESHHVVVGQGSR